MTAANTHDTYGSVTKTFHWMTALLILTAFPLGVVANNMAFDTSEALAAKAWVFSLHKTVGIAAFAIALGRILWALSQTKPAPMHPDRRGETFLAETVHWLLYASMLIVPLSGWLHHAATEGFAPILWPLGQTLPFVPTSETVALIFKEIHWLFTKVMAAAVFLHIAGALKHAFIDRDGTLARMCQGTDQTPPAAKHNTRAPILAALVIYLAGFGGAFALVQSHTPEAAPVTELAEVASDWQVTEGTLSITVQQLGAAVTGSFADWTASISFEEEATEGRHGETTVEIAISSLTLGSVTEQALDADFFNAAAFPTARFTASLVPADTGYLAEGTLSLRGAEVPVALPFTLEITGDTAVMTAEVTLDRRTFGMGESYPDENTVGFGVLVSVELTATRATAPEA
ncbi:MAG: cytochrome b/b6 domain-containing protein [Pseudomonadota bacterium]